MGNITNLFKNLKEKKYELVNGLDQDKVTLLAGNIATINRITGKTDFLLEDWQPNERPKNLIKLGWTEQQGAYHKTIVDFNGNNDQEIQLEWWKTRK